MKAIVFAKLEPKGVIGTLESVRKIKGVTKAFFTFGRYDLVAFIEAPVVGDICRVVLEINRLPNVTSTETLLEIQP